MAALAAAGADEGSWLRADRQSAGRGRAGRNWASDAGNLYMSGLVRLRLDDPPAPQIALVAALAAQQAAQAAVRGHSIHIKWPNDLIVGTAKLCGMLLERHGDAVIVGVGVNVGHAPKLADRETACLSALGASIDAPTLAVEVAEGFGIWLGRWRSAGLEGIRDAWLAAAHPVGTPLRVHGPDGEIVNGTFDGLASDGGLAIRMGDGQRRVIHAGDVFAV